MGAKKNTESTENTEAVEPKNLVKHAGACALIIGGVTHLPGAKFELSDEEVASQGIKYLFVTRVLAFVNDEERTEQLIADATKKVKVAPEKSMAELESGKTIE